MADTPTMSAASPQDIVAFQVFIWNKRRYAVPVNAQGEQLGPPLPFRNLNRHKRNGYGPGSGNTHLLEDPSSSPLLSPLEPPTGMAAVAPPPSFSEASCDSGYSSSSQGRSSRQRLSRSVSFIEKKPASTATESAAAAAGGSAGAAVVLPPALSEPAPASILQKKSSFRVTLRPLFDFDFEPPHTPPASASRRSSVKSKEDGSKEKPDTLWNPKTAMPGAGAANIAATAIPVHHHPSESFPSISPQLTTHTRPRTPPPPVTLHCKSDIATRFPRTDCCVSHLNTRGNKSSVPADGPPAALLIPVELRHRPLSDSFPPQTFASPTPSPSKAAKKAAAFPSMLAATAAPTELPPTTAAGEAFGTLTPPVSPPRSPSPSKAAAALNHTTARSPSPNDFSFELRYKVGPTTPQGGVKVAAVAAAAAAAAVNPPYSPPSATFICLCPKAQAKQSASNKVEEEKQKSHRGRKKQKGGAGVGRCITASLSKDTLPKEEKAEKFHENGKDGKTQVANNSSCSQQAAKSPVPVHRPSANLAKEDAVNETAEVRDDESLAPKYSDFLIPPKVTAVAALNTSAAATASTRASASIEVDNAFITAASGAATANTKAFSSSALTGKAQKDQPTAPRRSVSPNTRYSPELNASSVSSALAVYVEDRRRTNASPCARSNGDLYDLYRYAVLKPPTPTKASAAAPPTSAAPKPLSTPPEEKENEVDAAAAVGEAQLPSGSATSYDYQCSVIAKAPTPTKPKAPRAAPPAPLRRHTVGDPSEPHIAHFSPAAAATSLAAKERDGRAEQAMYNKLGLRVMLPPLSSRGPSGTGAESPRDRRHTAPQVVPVPTLRHQQQHQQRQRSATAPAVVPAAVILPPTVISSSSDEDSQPSVSDKASTVTTATDSTSSRSTFDADESDENTDGQSEDAGSASSFSYGDAEEDKKEEQHSASSCASGSPTPTSDSKTTATTSTSTTTTSTTTSEGVEQHQGSIWSSMMRRLRQPLITQPTPEEDTLLYHLNRYRHRRTPEKSRVHSGSRLEMVRAAGSRLSSVEMAGPVDPLQRRRRMKKEPYSEAAAARRK